MLQKWTDQLTEPPMVTEDGIDTSEWPQKNLIVAISSDRGLCGGETNKFDTPCRITRDFLYARGV